MASAIKPLVQTDKFLRGSPVPARWRILGWIVLTTALVLLAVLVTVRSLLAAEVDREANAAVVQEVQEFSTFAREGVDPQTARPYTSVVALLERYLARQNSADGEVLIGITDTAVRYQDRDGEANNPAPYNLHADTELIEQLRTSDAVSGVIETDGGTMRWGKAQVNAGDQRGALIAAEFTRPAHAEVQHTVTVIFFVALGGLLLTAGIAWLVAGQILRPIRDVRRVAAEISENDLTARVPVQGRDDVAVLAQTFNDMLDRLEKAYTTQRRFVDDASHELRTPITVIRGHLELLSDDPAERAATLRLVNDELSRMGRIVSDLLLLAKAERADFVQPRPVDTASLTLDIEAKIQALGDRRWLLMEVAEGQAPLDSQRVTQAMLQLAANAVQYSPEGSTIQLGSAFEGHGADRRVSFWIRDFGPGVAQDEAATIFERFKHGSANAMPADRLRAKGPRGGAGLGLSIVRAIADAHGGSAWLRSVPGEGATFGLLLPAPESETPDRPGTETGAETDTLNAQTAAAGTAEAPLASGRPLPENIKLLQKIGADE
jgi:two-component system, OmpR family, sensor kinase